MADHPRGTPFLIGRLHRSVATRINKGAYPHIDPNLYRAWSAGYDGTSSEIWIRRK
jgi:hypothetical protein